MQFVTFDPLVGSLKHTKKVTKNRREGLQQRPIFIYFHAYYVFFVWCPLSAKRGWRICIYQGKALTTSGGLILKQPIWKTFRKWLQFGSVNPSSLTQKIDISGEVCFKDSFYKDLFWVASSVTLGVLSACPGRKMMPKEAPNGRREVICEDALKWLGFEKMNVLGVGQVLIFAATVWSGKSYQYRSSYIHECWGATPTQQQWSFKITLHL